MGGSTIRRRQPYWLPAINEGEVWAGTQADCVGNPQERRPQEIHGCSHSTLLRAAAEWSGRGEVVIRVCFKSGNYLKNNARIAIGIRGAVRL